MILRNRPHEGNQEMNGNYSLSSSFLELVYYLDICVSDSCMSAVIMMTQKTKSTK